MPLRTINLSYDEESAAILILRGIHSIEPIGNFSTTGQFQHCYMFIRNDDVVKIMEAYGRSVAKAKQDNDTSPGNVLALYVRDEMIGDERGDIDDYLDDNRTFAEMYEDATR